MMRNAFKPRALDVDDSLRVVSTDSLQVADINSFAAHGRCLQNHGREGHLWLLDPRRHVEVADIISFSLGQRKVVTVLCFTRKQKHPGCPKPSHRRQERCVGHST